MCGTGDILNQVNNANKELVKGLFNIFMSQSNNWHCKIMQAKSLCDDSVSLTESVS